MACNYTSSHQYSIDQILSISYKHILFEAFQESYGQALELGDPKTSQLELYVELQNVSRERGGQPLKDHFIHLVTRIGQIPSGKLTSLWKITIFNG